MGLFDPIWMTKNPSKLKKAKESVSKITDINKLKEIAIKAPLAEVKCCAMYTVEDENILKELYLNKEIELSHFQLFLIDQIRDKKNLNEIAIQEAKDNYYCCAYNKDIDDKILNQIILDPSFQPNAINYGYEVLLKGIKTIDNEKDIDKIITNFSQIEGVERLAENQRDRIKGIKTYRGVCPTCHKEIRYHIFWDYYDEKQKEQSVFECGCGRCKVEEFDKECEIKKEKQELEGSHIDFCYKCGLPIGHDTAGYRKCMCRIGPSYLPISIPIIQDEW